MSILTIFKNQENVSHVATLKFQPGPEAINLKIKGRSKSKKLSLHSILAPVPFDFCDSRPVTKSFPSFLDNVFGNGKIPIG